MYVYTEQFTDDAIEVTLSPGARPGDERLRIKVGSTVIRTDVPEAVDLVYALIDQLAKVDDGRELRRDENAVRSDAEIRDDL